MKSFVRDSSWTMFQPGLYMDPAGEAHFFPDEILAFLNLEYTQENYDLVVEVITELWIERRGEGNTLTFAKHIRRES